MASLDGRLIVGFKERVSLDCIERRLQRFGTHNSDRFIDYNNLDHIKALLGFLPKKSLESISGLNGFKDWVTNALAEFLLTDEAIGRVFDYVSLSKHITRLKYLESTLNDTGKGLPATKLGRRVYAIRCLLSSIHGTNYIHNEDDLSTKMKKSRDVTFAEPVPYVFSYPDAKEDMVYILTTHYFLRGLELTISKKELTKRFPMGIPKDIRNLRQYKSLRATSERLFDGPWLEIANIIASSTEVRDNIFLPQIYRRMAEWNIATYNLLNQRINQHSLSYNI